MTKEEFIEQRTNLENAMDTISNQLRMCISEYIKERIPFDASRENPVLADISYSYKFKMNEFTEHGNVSGQVWIVGWETAEFYGRNHMPNVIPIMYRNTEHGMGEAAHFRLGTDFDSIVITPHIEVIKLEPEKVEPEQQIDSAPTTPDSAGVYTAIRENVEPETENSEQQE